MQRSRKNNRPTSRFPNDRQDVPSEHRFHFLGNAGGDENLAGGRDRGIERRDKLCVNPRRGSASVEDHLRTAGNHRLDSVNRGHRPSARLEKFPQLGEPLGILFQWRVHHRRQCLAGQIIFGRPDSAGNDETIAATGGIANRVFDRGLIVGNSHVRQDRDADGGQLPANPGRIRIDRLPEHQFIADR